MKIKKDRYAKIIISFIATFCILLLMIIAYVLGEVYTIKYTIAFIAITVACISLIWIICFLLVKFEQKYYIIDKDGIRLYKKNQLLFELRQDEILKARYNPVWGTFFDPPGGYAFFDYAYRDEEDKKFSIVTLNQSATHVVYMSLKQAKEAAFILDKFLEID